MIKILNFLLKIYFLFCILHILDENQHLQSLKAKKSLVATKISKTLRDHYYIEIMVMVKFKGYKEVGDCYFFQTYWDPVWTYHIYYSLIF